MLKRDHLRHAHRVAACERHRRRSRSEFLDIRGSECRSLILNSMSFSPHHFADRLTRYQEFEHKNCNARSFPKLREDSSV